MGSVSPNMIQIDAELLRQIYQLIFDLQIKLICPADVLILSIHESLRDAYLKNLDDIELKLRTLMLRSSLMDRTAANVLGTDV